MNAPLHPQVLLRPAAPPQQDLPLDTAGVLRVVWQHRFGAMLIEVVDGRVFVNGEAVEPAPPGPFNLSSGPRPGG
jgi:hypothetical protein